MTYENAWALLGEYNKEPFHLQHGKTVALVMEWFANKLGYEAEADYWKVVGLLHDLDFELYPEEHCVKGQQIMREKGIDESIIRACASHGWGQTAADVEPQHQMEKVLFAVDELTGLIGACARMRPSKSCKDMELKSLKKKFKTLSFAAGCDRQVISRGADMLGWELDQLLNDTHEAMKAVEDEIEG